MAETHGDYWEAEEIEPIARELIFQHHRHLWEGEANILYLFTSKERKSKGRITLATAQVANPLHRYLTGKRAHGEADFILIFDASYWRMMEPHQRTALVDHELCHCIQNEKGDGWAIRGHDLEEFTGVIERHGIWLPDVLRMAKAMEPHQHALPLFDEATMGIVTMQGKAADTNAGSMTVSSGGRSGAVPFGDKPLSGEIFIDEKLYNRAVKAAKTLGTISATTLQNRLGVRWDMAATLMNRLKAEGVIGGATGARVVADE